MEDENINVDYTGEHVDYVLLSENSHSSTEWNNDTREISLGFNIAQKKFHQCLLRELSHIINKIRAASLKQNLMLEDLVQLKFGQE